MSDYKFNCPHCNQSLEAPADMLGEIIECPACSGSIQLPAPQLAPPPLPRTRQPESTDVGFDSDAATEKQIAHIRALGGTPPPGLTKEAASDLIGKLRNSAPPTTKQLDLLKKLGGTITAGMTSAQASDLISQLDDNQPPTKQQIKFIKMLGGEVPPTKREASYLCDTLSTTAPATDQQKKRAQELGSALPDNATFAQANTLLGESEMDADEEDGKPPAKAQINKIVKLGGDPSKAVNRWRAEAYIEELEEKQETFSDRVDQTLESLFGDAEDRSLIVVRKPSKAVLAKALKYGDDQGWGEGWEDDFAPSSPSPYDRLSVAIYAVAPELLKKGESPPRLLSKAESDAQFRQALAWASGKQSARSKGCLVTLAVLLIPGVVFVVWCLQLMN